MQYQNSQKTLNSIALYYRTVDESVFADSRFSELINHLCQDKNFLDYSYALYCDSYLLRTNIFIPVFHTMYLSSGNKNVILNNYEDLWLLDAFKNNTYYMIHNDQYDLSQFNITSIPNIKSIL